MFSTECGPSGSRRRGYLEFMVRCDFETTDMEVDMPADFKTFQDGDIVLVEGGDLDGSGRRTSKAAS